MASILSIPEGSVKIGLSGFRFDGDKHFYPKGLSQDRYIEYYAEHFDVVEINTTYHALPEPEVFKRFNRLTPPDFGFTVKLPSSMTHRTDNPAIELDRFIKLISPLCESGKLLGLLAQFPFSFTFSEANIHYIEKLRGFFPYIPFFVEFRNIGWLKGTNSIEDILDSMDSVMVSVDEPDIEGLMPNTLFFGSGILYYRLHSRDKDKWFKGRESRYDYYYTDEELKEIIINLDSVTKKRLKALVFFNNCHQGSAKKNAEKMKLMLGQNPKQESMF